jgi:ribosomal protein L11 methyltransferase
VTTGARWYAVRISAGAGREAVAETLFRMGVGGIQELDEELRTHVPEGWDVAALFEAVLEASPGASIEAELIEPVDWTEAWKHGVGAHSLGELTIAPPWLAERSPPERTVLIDPGAAFGTGEHATTRGIVRLLPRFVREGDRVADLGAGSAVLSIAAAKLGAAWVAAIEADAQAIENAESNVVRNGVADRVRIIQGDAALLLPLVAPVRLVLANIISSVLLELLPMIASALTEDGEAILSGILGEEREPIVAALEAQRWTIVAEDREDVWWTVGVAR